MVRFRVRTIFQYTTNTGDKLLLIKQVENTYLCHLHLKLIRCEIRNSFLPMKILALVRHAKAEQPEPEQTDFDRNLTSRGKRNAAEMASIVKSNGFTPELLITSPAKRALKTASLFADEFAIEKKKILKKDFLYGSFGIPEIKELLHAEANDRDTVFIFGHNPVLSWLSATLSRSFSQGLPTSGVVIIEFDTDSWDKISPSNSKVLLYKYPSEIV